jgi:hypothetical protein
MGLSPLPAGPGRFSSFLCDRKGVKLSPSERRTLLQGLDAVQSVTDAAGWSIKGAIDEPWAGRVWKD